MEVIFHLFKFVSDETYKYYKYYKYYKANLNDFRIGENQVRVKLTLTYSRAGTSPYFTSPYFTSLKPKFTSDCGMSFTAKLTLKLGHNLYQLFNVSLSLQFTVIFFCNTSPASIT